VDPVPAIAEIAERNGIWLHVDSADARSAMICPEFRWAFAGCDRADALIVNPLKWLFTPMGTSVSTVNLVPTGLFTIGNVSNLENGHIEGEIFMADESSQHLVSAPWWS
jgi:hypothetical protein